MNERLTPMDGPRADPIVEETGKSGEDHASQFNYDVSAIADDLKKCQDERDDFEKSQRELGLPLVTLPPNRVPRPADTPDQPADRAA